MEKHPKNENVINVIHKTPKDDESSLCSGDTVLPGSPHWESHSNPQLKEWRRIRKQLVLEHSLENAMDLMGVDDGPKSTAKQTIESIKLPPLEKPKWFQRVMDELMDSDPPMVGPQVSRVDMDIFLVLVPPKKQNDKICPAGIHWS